MTWYAIIFFQIFDQNFENSDQFQKDPELGGLFSRQNTEINEIEFSFVSVPDFDQKRSL